jgi:hypothetical protein
MSEQAEGSPEFKSKDPVIIVKFPDDPLRAGLILKKRDEYLGRIAKSAGEYTHPEAAAVLQLSQGKTFCFDMLVRAELIRAIEAAGEKGVDIWQFADSFLSERPSFSSVSDPEFADALKQQIIAEAYVVRAYCEGNEHELSGGTGLNIGQSVEQEA